MNQFRSIPLVLLLALAASIAVAQSGESDALKIAALEALMAAPPERALPIVQKVLDGDGSQELKTRALFVLSQIDLPEATALLLDAAKNGSGDFQLQALRTIGINGNPETMAWLVEVYRNGNADVREAVLEAYLIANDADAVLQIAQSSESPDEFSRAVEALGAMGATEQLRSIRSRSGISEALIEAYATAGDVESLRKLAMDGSDPERQAKAIEGLAIAGGDKVNAFLIGAYRDAQSEAVRNAALQAMLIADYDAGVLELYRESVDAAEKRELLGTLVIMDSDAVWDIIDVTLGEQP